MNEQHRDKVMGSLKTKMTTADNTIVSIIETILLIKNSAFQACFMYFLDLLWQMYCAISKTENHSKYRGQEYLHMCIQKSQMYVNIPLE